MLEPLRAVADEIVVAVDDRAGTDELAHYAAVADCVLRYPRGPTHSSLTWLQAQCRCDWILNIAGDEVPSDELVTLLPELIARRDVLQYWIPLRWLFPDEARWLTGSPWHPDFHNRLVRNDGTLRFAGRKHELALHVLPARYLDAPLWHMNLLLLDEHARRVKAERNEDERPGLRAPDGRPLNAAYYLPEDARAAPTEAVPEADREVIRAALDPRPAIPEPIVAGQVRHADRPQIERLWAGRPIGEAAYRASLEPLLPQSRSGNAICLLEGEPATLHVRARNEGCERWPWGLELPPLFRIGFRWISGPAIDEPPPEGRVGLPHDLAPGESAIVPVGVVAPAAPGRWTLEIGMLHEGVRWFGSTCLIRVSVRAASKHRQDTRARPGLALLDRLARARVFRLAARAVSSRKPEDRDRARQDSSL